MTNPYRIPSTRWTRTNPHTNINQTTKINNKDHTPVKTSISIKNRISKATARPKTNKNKKKKITTLNYSTPTKMSKPPRLLSSSSKVQNPQEKHPSFAHSLGITPPTKLTKSAAPSLSAQTKNKESLSSNALTISPQ